MAGLAVLKRLEGDGGRTDAVWAELGAGRGYNRLQAQDCRWGTVRCNRVSSAMSFVRLASVG